MTMKKQKTLHRFAAAAAVLLAFCLVFMMPVGAAEGVVEVYTSDALIAAVEAGGTVQLTQDITVSTPDSSINAEKDEAIEITKDVTLILNGHTLTSSVVKNRTFWIVNDGITFTIDGTVTGSKMLIDEGISSYGFVNINATNAKLVINGGTYIGTTDSGSLFKTYGYADEQKMRYNYAESISLQDVVVETNYLAVEVYTHTISIKDSKFTLNAGRKSSLSVAGRGVEQDYTGVFDNVTITSVQSDHPCLEVSNMFAKLTDCKFTLHAPLTPSTGQAPPTALAVSGGAVVDIEGGEYISQSEYVPALETYTSSATVNIKDGVYISSPGNAIYIYNHQGYPSATTMISISGGEISGGIEFMSPEGNTLSITGGTFSTDVSKYVAEGYVCVSNGENSYLVIEKPADAVIPELPEVTETDDVITVTGEATIQSSKGEDGSLSVTITKTDSDSGIHVAIIVTNVDENSYTAGENTIPKTADSEVGVMIGKSNTDTEPGFALALQVNDHNSALPILLTNIDDDVAAAADEYRSGQSTVLSMITAAEDNLEAVNDNIGQNELLLMFIVPMDLVNNKNNLVVYHVDGEGVTPLEISDSELDEENGVYIISVISQLGFSSYVLVEEEPQQYTGGSATDTGAGNYQYYPRSVPTDGIIDFGTSRVVTGMELPAGSDGTVTLNIKPTFAMPENGFYAFEIDAPGYNLDAKINGGLSFQIPVADLEAAGWTAEDIVLFHGTVGEDGKITWEALPTNLVKNENGVAYYKAAINGCSPFYIGFVKDGSVVNTEVVDPVTPETPVTPDEPEVLPPVDEPETPEQPTESPAPILAVLAGLGAAVVLRRK